MALETLREIGENAHLPSQMEQYVDCVIKKRKNPLPGSVEPIARNGFVVIGEAIEAEFDGKWRARTTTLKAAMQVARSIPHSGDWDYLTQLSADLARNGFDIGQSVKLVKGFVCQLFEQRTSHKTGTWLNSAVLDTSRRTASLGNVPLAITPTDRLNYSSTVLPVTSQGLKYV